MIPKTSDICDACDEAQACSAQFQSYGQKVTFAGPIRTIRCFEDIGLMRDVVNQRGDGHVLVIDGAGSLAKALFGDVMAAISIQNGWSGLIINGGARLVGFIARVTRLFQTVHLYQYAFVMIVAVWFAITRFGFPGLGLHK